MSKLYLKLAGIVGVIIGVVGLADKVKAANIIDVGTGVASTTAYIGDLFTDISAFIWLAIGIPLGFYVIKRVVSLVRAR